jgi:ethanolamine ammonia-lyase small subunit
VALGDQVAAALGAASVLVLIGERPGLSAPDSLGAYLTWAPRPGTTDAERNCVSNIRPDGLDPAQAARTLAFLLARMRALRLSGVALKDESDRSAIRQVG